MQSVAGSGNAISDRSVCMAGEPCVNVLGEAICLLFPGLSHPGLITPLFYGMLEKWLARRLSPACPAVPPTDLVEETDELLGNGSFTD